MYVFRIGLETELYVSFRYFVNLFLEIFDKRLCMTVRTKAMYAGAIVILGELKM